MSIYEQRITKRSLYRYFLGLFVRWKANFKYEKARKIAKKNGAQIGEGVVMPISLAKRINSNSFIGNHVSIQTDKIDTRSKIVIGNNVIIGDGTEIITGSHNIDSVEFEYKQYGLIIEDYVWIPTKILVLPSCRRIGYGAVISSGSVVVKDVAPMTVVSGNPAKEIKKRKCVHSSIVVESMLGGDYYPYKNVWKKRRKEKK